MTTDALRPTADEPVRMNLVRFLWAAPLTLAVSVIAVLLIRAIAVGILHPSPQFLPLTPEPPVFDTVFFGTCAVLVFLALGRYSVDAIRSYRSLAWKVLIFTFGPISRWRCCTGEMR